MRPELAADCEQSRSGVLVLVGGQERLEALGKELAATTTTLDATHFAAVESCLRDTASRHGRVAGVMNAVGSILPKPAHLTSEEEWHETLAQNLTSAFAVTRAAGHYSLLTGLLDAFLSH